MRIFGKWALRGNCEAGPETFIRGLEAGLEPAKHGVVLLHFYTFGGFKGTAEWIAHFRQEL
jgi:methylenetetrahydrofolate reductase (NADPH)